MTFDVQHQIVRVFDRQHAFLISSADDAAPFYDALEKALYNLIDGASEADYQGVADGLALYGELLTQVCTEGQQPPHHLKELLEKVSERFLTLAETPEAVPGLLQALADDRWPEPVPEDDLQFLEEILLEDVERLQSANDETSAEIELEEVILEPAASSPITHEEATESADSIAVQSTNTVDYEETEIELDEVVLLDAGGTQAQAEPTNQSATQGHFHEQSTHLLGAADNATKADCLHTLVDEFSELGLSGFADSCALAAELLSESPEDNPTSLVLVEKLTALFNTPSDDHVTALVSALTDSAWTDPVPEDDAEFLQELLQDDLSSITAETTSSVSDVAPSVESAAVITDAINDEIVLEEEIILEEASLGTAAEASPLSDDTASQTKDSNTSKPLPAVTQAFCEIDFTLLQETGPNIDPAVLQMLTQSLSPLLSRWQQLEETDDGQLAKDSIDALMPVQRALDTLHLRGICILIGGLEINLQLMANGHSNVENHEQMALILQTVSDHFNAIEDQEIQRTLIDLCSSPALPCPATEDQSAFLGGMLSLASIQTAQDIVKETAKPEDVALSLQDDLDPNLLDMLFEELPSLTDDFLNNLQEVISSGSLKNLDAARRTAHTIKGLGNMAGIQGLANLTHGLEDILDKLVDTQSLPGDALRDDLLEAADCLASMSESVTEKLPAPQSAQAILQLVMDWSYRLKTEGVEASAKPLPASEIPPGAETASEAAEAEQTDSQERKEEQFLRVPQSLMDNLFRITGESNTLTSQLNETITELRTLTRTNRERQRHMQRIIFELEQQLNEYQTLHPELDPEADSFDPLEMDNYNEMHTSLARLHESAADVREVEQEMDEQIRHLTQLHSTQSGLQKESMANVLNTRLVSVKSISSRMQRIMRQACRAADKRARLIIEGEDTQIDSQILAQLTDPLMHVIRNAVDHGLESEQQRVNAGKAPEGSLTLRFAHQNDEIRVTCEDDGDGIDTNKVRTIAARKGLVEEHIILTEPELQRLILLPGFSTSEEVSQLSGRGIGMDVVHQQIMRMQGSLNISSTRGQGTRFDLTLPASSLMIRALLVRAGRQLVALSSHGIEQSMLSMDGTIESTEDGNRFIVGEDSYPLVGLETLLAEPRPDYGKEQIYPILIISLGQHEKVALQVKEIVAHRELVFKQMGEYVPDIPGIPGITILSNGEAAPVIDLPARIRHQQSGHIELNSEQEQDLIPELPKLMVVDDSISARKSLATFLKDTGYDVSTAIDGLDALNQIRKNPPDLVLTDLEMPRMTGIELSSAIRNNQKTGDIPVIMITSRSTDKHRDEADAAGVSDYVIKPWTEEGLLSRVQTLLN